MKRKVKARELAMQLLFLWDSHGQPEARMTEQMLTDSREEESVCRMAQKLAEGAWEFREAADRWMERLAPGWPPRRQPGVDRAVLRLGIWEMTNTTIPGKVVIDECVRMAKHFSTANSASFTNGLLDAVFREHKAITEGATPEPQVPIEPPLAADEGTQSNS